MKVEHDRQVLPLLSIQLIEEEYWIFVQALVGLSPPDHELYKMMKSVILDLVIIHPKQQIVSGHQTFWSIGHLRFALGKP